MHTRILWHFLQWNPSAEIEVIVVEKGRWARYLGTGRKGPGAALETCPCDEQ